MAEGNCIITIVLTLFVARPDELDVKVEGNNIIITAKQEIQEAGGTRQEISLFNNENYRSSAIGTNVAK
jgi:hypothetical protein